MIDLIVECGPAIEDGYQARYNCPAYPCSAWCYQLLAIGVMRAAADGASCSATCLWSAMMTSVAKYLAPRLTTVSKDALRLGRSVSTIRRIQGRISLGQVDSARFVIRGVCNGAGL
jgi:hypothetical protein